MLKSIQSLRAVAALLVLLYHILEPLTPPGSYWGGLGAIGVDLFFVVSGCVMVLSTQGRDLTFSKFFGSRLRRIAPLYWLSLAVFLAILAVTEPGAVPLSEAVQSFLFVPYMDSRTGEPVPFLGPGWTLNYEMLFYLLFGATLFLRSATKQVALLSVVFAGFVALRPALGDTAVGLRFTSPLLFEFIEGAVIGLLADRLQRQPLWLSAGALCAAFGLIVGLSVGPELPRVLAFGVPAALIVAGVLGLERLAADGRMALLEWWGAASYSLYLSHAVALYVVKQSGVSFGSPVADATAKALISLAVAAGTYKFIERPLGALVSRSIRLLPTKAAVAS